MSHKLLIRQCLLVSLLVCTFGSMSQAVKAANIGYITGTDLPGGGDGNPWNNDSNDQALDVAFGQGNWDKFSFGNAVQDGVFDLNAYKVLYVDGGDDLGDLFRGFVDNNRGSLESWVSNGGSLYLNAARNNSFGALDLGFGAVLNSESFPSTISAVDPAHPIFNGPVGITGNSFSGFFPSHDFVTGTNLTPLINSELGQIVLAEQRFNSGLVLFGGLTTANFHSPQPEALILRANILDYAAIEAGLTPTPGPIPVPEDPRISLVPVLLLSFFLIYWSRIKQKTAV
jgi:hypothetical protein